MSHTFDIRFDRSGGLAALLEAPTNSFRWKGRGRLVIDTHGVSIAVKRGLFSFLSRNRTRRIPSAGLWHVFREGDALRLEFATDGAARAFLLFWARDRDTAAQIVNLMPTSRTVELEADAGKRRFQFNWRGITLLGVALTAMTFGVVALRAERTDEPVAETEELARAAAADGSRAGEAEASAVASTKPEDTSAGKLPAADVIPSRLARPREIVIPVYPGRPASATTSTRTPELDSPLLDQSDPVAIATPERTTIAQAAAPPTLVFRVRVSPDGIVPLVAGMAGYEAASREIAVFGVESEQGMWWEMTVRIHNSPAFDDPALWPLRDAELAASRAWRNYYQFYRGSGLNEESAEYQFARLLTARVSQYVD